MSDLECVVKLSDGRELSFEGDDLKDCYLQLLQVSYDNPKCEVVATDVTDLETGEVRMSYDLHSGWQVSEGELPAYLVDEQRDWERRDAAERYDDTRDRIDHGVPYYNAIDGVAVYRDDAGGLYVAKADMRSVGEAFTMFARSLPPNVYQRCDVTDAVAFLSDSGIFRSRAVVPVEEDGQAEAIAKEIEASKDWQVGDHAHMKATLEEAGYRVEQRENAENRSHARQADRQPSTIETILSRKGR